MHQPHQIAKLDDLSGMGRCRSQMGLPPLDLFEVSIIQWYKDKESSDSDNDGENNDRNNDYVVSIFENLGQYSREMEDGSLMHVVRYFFEKYYYSGLDA